MKTLTIITYVVFFNIIPLAFIIGTFVLESNEIFMIGFTYTMLSALIFIGIKKLKSS
jgi:hypothetical protein